MSPNATAPAPRRGCSVSRRASSNHNSRMQLDLLPSTFAIARLPADAAIPAWAAGEFVSITRTADELSVVGVNVPDDVQAQRGYRCLKIRGPLDFEMVGVVASIAEALARAG